MKKFGKLIVKLRIPILILSVLLLIPAAIGYFNTKVNYDILYYLPGDIDTMKGQDILLDDFGKGAYAMVVVDGMNKKNVSELVKKVEKVDHVASVISYSGIVGDGVPSEILPDKFRSYFENDDSGATLFAIFFDDTTIIENIFSSTQPKTESEKFVKEIYMSFKDGKADFFGDKAVKSTEEIKPTL